LRNPLRSFRYKVYMLWTITTIRHKLNRPEAIRERGFIVERATIRGISSVGRAVRLVLIGSGLLLAETQIAAAQESSPGAPGVGSGSRTDTSTAQRSASDGQSAQLEEIVVTGTRIARPAGATSPTPTTVVSSTTMQQMGLSNIG